ncbi:hypothetical protein HanIR_Chr15g0740011 [Helianthus annuus]|nr:hypothetical protein HanIR_Chr15g0740011 [Helianthus annuus]
MMMMTIPSFSGHNSGGANISGKLSLFCFTITRLPPLPHPSLYSLSLSSFHRQPLRGFLLRSEPVRRQWCTGDSSTKERSVNRRHSGRRSRRREARGKQRWLFGWSEDRGWWVMVGAEVNGGDGGWSVVGRQGVSAMSVVPMVRSMSVLGGGGRGCLFRGGGYRSDFLCCLGGGYRSNFLCYFCWSYVVCFDYVHMMGLYSGCR